MYHIYHHGLLGAWNDYKASVGRELTALERAVGFMLERLRRRWAEHAD